MWKLVPGKIQCCHIEKNFLKLSEEILIFHYWSNSLARCYQAMYVAATAKTHVRDSSISITTWSQRSAGVSGYLCHYIQRATAVLQWEQTPFQHNCALPRRRASCVWAASSGGPSSPGPPIPSTQTSALPAVGMRHLCLHLTLSDKLVWTCVCLCSYFFFSFFWVCVYT